MAHTARELALVERHLLGRTARGSLTVLRELAPLLGPSDRRRIRGLRASWSALAVLDALGIALVLPLAQTITRLDQPPDGMAGFLSDWTGIDDSGDLVVVLACATVTLFLVKSASALVLLRTSLAVVHDLEVRTADRLIRSFLDAPLVFHLGRTSAALQRTVNEGLRRIFEEGLATEIPAFGDRLVLALVGLVLLGLAPLQTLIAAAFLLVVYRVYSRLAGRAAAASTVVLLQRHERSVEYVQQALDSIREISITGTAGYFSEQLGEVRRSIAERQRTLSLWEQLPRYYLELAIVLGVALVAASTFLQRPAVDALGIITLFVAAGFRTIPSLNRLLVARTKARVAGPHLQRLLTDLHDADDAAARMQPDRHSLPLGRSIERIDLERVTLRYPGSGTPALDDLSLAILRGQHVGIVGASGAGKSTLVGVLLGLLDPTEGTVLIDRHPLSECRASLHERMGYVPQEVVILNRTIRENVAFGVPPCDIDDDRVWQVLSVAQLDGVIRELPSGLDEVAGEAGERFSGGQRQRLGIARALYRQPELLVLDEATASLDTDTERRILDRVTTDELGLTIVTIAHRPSAVHHCEPIHLLHRGSLVATGTWNELATTSATFMELMRVSARDGEADALP